MSLKDIKFTHSSESLLKLLQKVGKNYTDEASLASFNQQTYTSLVSAAKTYSAARALNERQHLNGIIVDEEIVQVYYGGERLAYANRNHGLWVITQDEKESELCELLDVLHKFTELYMLTKRIEFDKYV